MEGGGTAPDSLMEPDDDVLWALEKAGQRLVCRVRTTRFATELRVMRDGEPWWSYVYSGKRDTAVEEVSEAKRAELEGQGWTRTGAD
jgi:hypothetical protein